MKCNKHGCLYTQKYESRGKRDCDYHHNKIRIQRDHFKSVLEGISEGDCSYGDNCPEFGTRHGRCVSCIAKSALRDG